MGDPISPTTSKSMVGVLRHHAVARAGATAMGYLDRGERLADTATYAGLDDAARRIARSLSNLDMAGRPVLLPMTTGLSAVKGFLGCLYAGALAVPVPPQWQARDRDRTAAIISHARTPLALSADKDDADKMRSSISAADHPMQVVTVADALTSDPLETVNEPAPDQAAFIQYTSGSTGTPKGIAVTHANIMANQAMISDAFGHDGSTVVVSWLPLHHDMGLIGCILQPLYLGGRSMLMSPLAFLQKPLRWLAAIDAHRATSSGAPSFGFDLCVRRVGEDAAARLDLSSWRLAFCGAETVRLAVMQSFAARFGRGGFDARALYPCYGLAEATLFVTGLKAGSGVRHRSFARADMDTDTTGTPVGTISSRDMVSCGHGWRDARIAIIDQTSGEPVTLGEVGEICVSGGHVSPGYWRPEAGDIAPEAGQRITLDRRDYLRTGDLGVEADGELFVVGRIRDMIIVRGANIHAEDVEDTVMSADLAMSIAAAAAFAVETGDAEELVVVCEIGRRDFAAENSTTVMSAIAKLVADNHGVLPVDIVLTPRGAIDRTTSGKVRRSATRALYLEGCLKAHSALKETPAAGGAMLKPGAK